jgi:hypothetical protein
MTKDRVCIVHLGTTDRREIVPEALLITLGIMKGGRSANVVICTVKPNAAFWDGKWE